MGSIRPLILTPHLSFPFVCLNALRCVNVMVCSMCVFRLVV